MAQHKRKDTKVILRPEFQWACISSLQDLVGTTARLPDPGAQLFFSLTIIDTYSTKHGVSHKFQQTIKFRRWWRSSNAICQRRFAKHHELWNNVGLGYMRLRQLWSWNWCNVIRRRIWSSRLVELRQCAVNVMWGSGPVLFTYWMRGWWNVRFVQCEVRGWRNISGRLCEAEVAWSLCICQVCTLRGRGSVRFAYSSLIWGSASVRLVWCEVQVLWHEVHEMV